MHFQKHIQHAAKFTRSEVARMKKFRNFCLAVQFQIYRFQSSKEEACLTVITTKSAVQDISGPYV